MLQRARNTSTYRDYASVCRGGAGDRLVPECRDDDVNNDVKRASRLQAAGIMFDVRLFIVPVLLPNDQFSHRLPVF